MKISHTEKPAVDTEQIFTVCRGYLKLRQDLNSVQTDQGIAEQTEQLELLVSICSLFTVKECHEIAHAVVCQLRREAEFKDIWDLSRIIFGLLSAAVNQSRSDSRLGDGEFKFDLALN